MPRVTQEEVKEILEADPDRPLTAFIAAANNITNWLANQTSSLTTTELKEIERWLSAHAYVHMDQMLAEEETGDAKGVYQGQFGKRLDSTQYGQMALTLDHTGNLIRLSKETKPKASVSWLGTSTDRTGTNS